MGETFIPLAFILGDAVQGDWGEAVVELNGARRKVQYWCSKLCASRAPFVIMAFPTQAQEAFLEAQRQSFEFWGGIPSRQIYDNLKTAVKRRKKGEIVEQEAFLAFQGHYRFKADYCNTESPQEKGQVENFVGYVRRQFFVPMPEFSSFDELNDVLRAQCQAYLKKRHPDGKETIGEALEKQRRFLRSLPDKGFACCKSLLVTANKTSLVKFDGNHYSVPTQFRSDELMLRAFVDRVEVATKTATIATHTRCYEKGLTICELDHHLDALERKPRALLQSKPFQQADLSTVFHELHRQLRLKDSRYANQQWTQIFLLSRDFGIETLERAIQTALELGVIQLEAIRQMCLQARGSFRPSAPAVLQHLPELAKVRVSHSSPSVFNCLLERKVAL